MSLGRAPDRDAFPGAGFDAFARALLAMAWVVVGWTKVRQAVVVAWRHVVDGVGAGKAAEVADVAVELEDRPAAAGDALPVAGETFTAVRVPPASTGHDEDLRVGRLWANGTPEAARGPKGAEDPRVLGHDEALEALRLGRLRPGDVVGIRLVGGKRLFGTVVEAGPDGVTVKPVRD